MQKNCGEISSSMLKWRELELTIIFSIFVINLIVLQMDSNNDPNEIIKFI